MTTSPRPYGSWPSPISAADVARARRRLSFPAIRGEHIWWQETQPEAGGRTTIIRSQVGGGSRTDLLPKGWSARTRVHEYGGRSYLPLAVGDDYGLVFSHYADQRLYRLDPGAARPRPLTPAPAERGGLRYADLTLSPRGDELWCVREQHSQGEVTRAIVAVPLDGSAAEEAPRQAAGAAAEDTAGATDQDTPQDTAGEDTAVRTLVSGAQFFACPTPAPDGRHLAWITWDHPLMPWDGTELRVAVIEDDGTLVNVRTVQGGQTESVLAPTWHDNKSLYAVSDWPGWWNLYQIGIYGEAPRPLYPAEEEFAGPLWQLGGMPYAVLDDGRLAVLHGQGSPRLGVLDPRTGELTDVDVPYTDWSFMLSAAGTRVVGVAGGPTTPSTVTCVDLDTGQAGELRRELDELPDAACLPTPREVELAGPFGRPVHAYVYPPSNPDADPPADERPPYVAFVHGGPTGRTTAVLDLEIAFFTSRGIGVVDVNYGGSAGYGRSYRERLRRQWGVVDVEDVVAAVESLVERGEADPGRLAIRGGSAGGWTTLAAVTQSDVFKAGTSYFGISDLTGFEEETHDFESKYLVGLIGPLPAYRHTYTERSPLSHADQTACPVLLLQGLDDPIVLPAQSEKFAAALADKNVPYAYLAFEGESHGFRKAGTVIACLEAELAFYCQTLGLGTPDVPPVELTVGRSPGSAGSPSGSAGDSQPNP